MNRTETRVPSIILAIPLAEVAFWDRLVAELRGHGYDVRVWSEMPETEYRTRRGLLGGLWMRFRVLGVFPWRVIIRSLFVLRRHGAILLAPTTPFYLPAVAAVVLRATGLQVVHLLYDLYPDQLVLAGKVRHGSLGARVLAWSTRIALRHCAATVFLGEHLKQAAEGRYGTARRSVIIEVGGDGNLFPSAATAPAGVIRLLYAGNFGYAHDYETICDLLAQPLPAGLELVFHASGAGYGRFKQELARRGHKARAVLAGPLETADWAGSMAGAQVALVTMRSGAEGILFPSKTYSAMLAGQAILAVCPRASDLADTIESAGAGWVVSPGDADGLRALLERLASNPELVQQARVRSQTYAREHFDMAVIAKKWERLLSDLEAMKGET
jgi:glycosyltransferase involved in cell wall biosynthesis